MTAAPHIMDADFRLRQTTPEAVRSAFGLLTDLSSADSRSLEALVRINTHLQTTLDIQSLIKIFADEMHGLVSFDGLCYAYPDHDLVVELGKSARNICVYRLIVSNDLLGELTISRRRKFTLHETQTIEHLLCALVYPLRNALTYLSALRAAHKDALTGVNNRSALDSALVREVDMARRHRTSLSLIMMDLDRFKSINDTYGHAAGDTIIKAFTGVVDTVIRKSDMLFRFGGEEFVLLLSNTTRTGAILLAERIRLAVEQSIISTGHQIVPITVSLGVANLGPDDTHQSLFEKADQALYHAKSEGRNCVRCLTHGIAEIA